MKTKLIFIFLIIFLLSGCVNYESIVEQESVEDKVILNLGIVPAESPIKLIEQYKPFSKYLFERTNINLRIIPLQNYNEIYQQIQDGFIDIGVFGSYGAAKGIRDYNLYPLARPVRENNRSFYRGLVFTKKKYEIKDISELEGRSFAYVSKETSAGYFFPRDLIKKLGKKPDTFFSKTIFSGRHDLVVDAVMNEKVIAGAVKDDIYYKMLLENPEIEKELVIIHESIDFPDRTFLINPTISNEIISQLQKEMLSMHKDEEGKKALSFMDFKKFIKTDIDDFKETLKVDIE